MEHMALKVCETPCLSWLETKGVLALAKPRLVARDAAAPKSPWKYHKVPTLSTEGVPVSIKSLLSCILWRLHEYENNPLMPELFILLSDNPEISTVVQKLGIPIKSTNALYESLQNRRNTQDERDIVGQLEKEFAVKKRKLPTEAIGESPKMSGENLVSDACADICIGSEITSTAQNEDPNGKIVSEVTMDAKDKGQASPIKELEENDNDANRSEKQQGDDKLVKLDGGVKRESSDNAGVESNSDSTSSSGTTRNGPSIVVEDQQTSLKPATNGIGHNTINGDKAIIEGHPDHLQIANGQVDGNLGVTAEISEDGEDSDDDEVVVFDPKSRRSSGIPKAPTEPAKRATTPISYLKALESGLPRKPIESFKSTATATPPQTPRPDLFKPETLSETRIENPVGKRPSSSGVGAARSPPSTQGRYPKRHSGHVQFSPAIVSNSQDQIPVQGQIQTPAPFPSQIQRRPTPVPQPQAENQNEDGYLARPDSDVQDPGLTIPPNGALTAVQPPAQSVIQSQFQRVHQPKSHYLSQRSTQYAVHRFDQASGGVRRQVHKQPTSQPTVIDPDAFDRSYIIKPRPHTPNGSSNGNHRIPSPRLSPRRATGTPEAEVDFVLKSGAPRAATRGRGKLWVP